MSAPSDADEPSQNRPSASASECLFRVLLRAYPASFRADYGREMTLLFNDQRREARSSAGLWAAVIWDVVRSAPRARVEAVYARQSGHTRHEEYTMKPISTLAVLVGTVEMLNALIEAVGGWRADRGAAWMLSVAAALLAGGLLVAAGIALIRRSPRAGSLARTAAVVCLAVFAGAGLLPPWMSVFARLLGVGFPVALLAFLPSAQGRGPAAPITS